MLAAGITVSIGADGVSSSGTFPTLVIVGDRGHWCTKVSRFIAETIPGAELVVIRNSGHMTNLEQRCSSTTRWAAC